MGENDTFQEVYDASKYVAGLFAMLVIFVSFDRSPYLDVNIFR
jgi:hypothetical protein